MKLSWYAQRIRVMGWREIFYRFKEVLNLIALRIQSQYDISNQVNPITIQRFKFCQFAGLIPEPNWNFSLLKKSQPELFQGYWPALAYQWKWEDDSSWFIAPDTQERWPKKFFASIQFREGNPYGDVRVMWEPARMQQLVFYGLLTAHGGSPREKSHAAGLLKAQLLSWLRANPCFEGVHYISSMECGLRLIAVCHAAELARCSLSEDVDFWEAVVRLSLCHAGFIEKRLSLYSSAGNHTIAECAGLIYAGLLFPEHARAGSWVRQGLSIFEVELKRQILPDGGGAEQALWYHVFVTDLACLVDNLLQYHGHGSQIVSECVARARKFNSSFARTYDDVPAIGDSDNGYALSFLLNCAWGDAEQKLIQSYSDSGYTVINSQYERFIFDHGSLGLSPSYGHGHADALSILLRLNEYEVLRDSGTYTYTGHQEWREYFRGTSAHNTVTINGKSQVKMVTPFMWACSYHAELVYARSVQDERCLLLAYHNGYVSIGYRHWRGIVYRVGEGMLVWDFIEMVNPGSAEPACTIHWHVAGTCEMKGDVSEVRIDGKVVCRISTTNDRTLCFGHKGRSGGGWSSRVYGKKTSAYTLNIAGQGISSDGVNTIFSFDSDKFLSANCYAQDVLELRHEMKKFQEKYDAN